MNLVFIHQIKAFIGLCLFKYLCKSKDYEWLLIMQVYFNIILDIYITQRNVLLIQQNIVIATNKKICLIEWPQNSFVTVARPNLLHEYF